MQQGLAGWRATGAKVFRPYGLALLAEASLQSWRGTRQGSLCWPRRWG